MNVKVYVAVKAYFREDGTLIPFELTWEDGHTYAIDKVTDIRQAAAMRAGGAGRSVHNHSQRQTELSVF